MFVGLFERRISFHHDHLSDLMSGDGFIYISADATASCSALFIALIVTLYLMPTLRTWITDIIILDTCGLLKDNSSIAN